MEQLHEGLQVKTGVGMGSRESAHVAALVVLQRTEVSTKVRNTSHYLQLRRQMPSSPSSLGLGSMCDSATSLGS